MPSVSLDSTFVAGSDVVLRAVDEQMVLLHLPSGKYFHLDSLGARIWNLLVEHRHVGTVYDVLCAEYRGPRERVRDDLLALIDSLIEQGLGRLR